MSKKRPIKCRSWKEAEAKVLEMLNQGKPWAEITTVTFEVDNQIRRFNPKKISQIRKGDSGERDNNEKILPPEHIDSSSSLIFQLLRKGKSLTDIVIEQKLDPVIVQKAFSHYVEFNNFVLCPKEIFDSMKSLVVDIYEDLDDPSIPVPKIIDFKEISDWLHYSNSEIDL